MRVVGYVRESADPSVGRSAFGQQEEIRRHSNEQGHQLVALCQDLRSPGQPPSRDGYISLLGVIAAGGVEAVLVPGVATFSSDAIVQEIILWDLRERGVRVVSTEQADLQLLDPLAAPEPSRMLIRDVLERVGEHTGGVGPERAGTSNPPADGDVLVRIIQADTHEQKRVGQTDDH